MSTFPALDRKEYHDFIQLTRLFLSTPFFEPLCHYMTYEDLVLFKKCMKWNPIYERILDQFIDQKKPPPAPSGFYVPLTFWFFNSSPTLTTPLIALPYHETKINITLGSDNELIIRTPDDVKDNYYPIDLNPDTEETVIAMILNYEYYLKR